MENTKHIKVFYKILKGKCYYRLMFTKLWTAQDPQLKPMSLNFSWMWHCVLSKGESFIPCLFSGPEVLSSASDKVKLFAKSFSKQTNLDTQVSLYLFDILKQQTKYLRKTLVFMWNSALQEKFDLYLQGIFC